MKAIKINPKFKPTQEERQAYEALPDNMPDTKLTAKQTNLVDSLYFKYLTPIDNSNWSANLVEIEMREKWPSGPRMKRVQAKRICLNALFSAREKMTTSQAVNYFFHSLENRESWRMICHKIYSL